MIFDNYLQIWAPLMDIPKRLLIKSLCDDFDGFKVVLYEDGQEINNVITFYTIQFKSHLAYRNLDESYHLRTWDEIKFPKDGGSLYKTNKGNFIDSFNHLSYDIYKDQIINYIITTSNDVLEIITFVDAKVLITISRV